MWTLTGFADEVSKDFDEQLALMTKLGITHIELRSAGGTRVLDLTDEQLDEITRKLAAADIKVSSVGSDLGKIQITDDFAPHLERTKRGMEVAKKLGSSYLRTFSFFLPEDEDPAQHRDEVMNRLRQMVAVAEDAGVTFLHENEKDIYGDTPERVQDLHATIASENFRFIFDPANYVQVGSRPFDDAYPTIGGLTEYVHIKDALASDDSVVPAGQGDGQIPQVLAQLEKDGFDGFLSIEPHLGDFDAFGGLSGPDLWIDAHTALTGVLREAGIDYR